MIYKKSLVYSVVAIILYVLSVVEIAITGNDSSYAIRNAIINGVICMMPYAAMIALVIMAREVWFRSAEKVALIFMMVETVTFAVAELVAPCAFFPAFCKVAPGVTTFIMVIFILGIGLIPFMGRKAVRLSATITSIASFFGALLAAVYAILAVRTGSGSCILNPIAFFVLQGALYHLVERRDDMHRYGPFEKLAYVFGLYDHMDYEDEDGEDEEE